MRMFTRDRATATLGVIVRGGGVPRGTSSGVRRPLLPQRARKSVEFKRDPAAAKCVSDGAAGR